jgi:ATP-dependent DNA ligase
VLPSVIRHNVNAGHRLRKFLGRRREMLAEMCYKLDTAEVPFSAGVIGAGAAFFQAVVAHGHEGVMAKQLNSAYRPGKRSPAWKKLKPRLRKRQDTCVHC